MSCPKACYYYYYYLIINLLKNSSVQSQNKKRKKTIPPYILVTKLSKNQKEIALRLVIMSSLNIC